MLSVLFREQFDNLRDILDFYVPEGSLILDVTYGHGKLWMGVGANQNWKDKYHIITNDIDPESPAQFHLSFKDLAESPKIRNTRITDSYGFIDAVIYDPPYKYDSPSFIFYQRKDEDWKPIKTKWRPIDQLQTAIDLDEYITPLLKKDGLLIVKIMDTRYKGQLMLNHNIIYSTLCKDTEYPNYIIKDVIIYVRLGVGVFKNNKSAQTAHGYYLIFKKK